MEHIYNYNDVKREYASYYNFTSEEMEKEIRHEPVMSQEFEDARVIAHTVRMRELAYNLMMVKRRTYPDQVLINAMKSEMLVCEQKIRALTH